MSRHKRKEATQAVFAALLKIDAMNIPTTQTMPSEGWPPIALFHGWQQPITPHDWRGPGTSINHIP